MRWATTSVLPVPGPASTIALVSAALCAMLFCAAERRPDRAGSSFFLCSVGDPISRCACLPSFGSLNPAHPIREYNYDTGQIGAEPAAVIQRGGIAVPQAYDERECSAADIANCSPPESACQDINTPEHSHHMLQCSMNTGATMRLFRVWAIPRGPSDLPCSHASPANRLGN